MDPEKTLLHQPSDTSLQETIIRQADTPAGAQSPTPSGFRRRWSTLDDYKRIYKRRPSWVEAERMILRAEVLHEQYQSEPLLAQRNWGMWRISVCPIYWHIRMVTYLYSRGAARAFGTVIATLFFILGVYLYAHSSRVVELVFPYSSGDTSIEFELLEPMRAPIYVHLRLTNFWQSSRSFWSAQPPYFGRGFSCHGLTRAKDFCKERPTLKPHFLGEDRSFCDLPPETEVTPCGRYTLMINLDEITIDLLQVKQEAPTGVFARASAESHEASYRILHRTQPERTTNEATKTKTIATRTAVASRGRNSPAPNSLLPHVPDVPPEVDSANRSSMVWDASFLAVPTPEGGTKSILIQRDADTLLSSYQRHVVYPREMSIVSRYVSEHPQVVSWLAVGDLRWFLWRRPALTQEFQTLYGKIKQNLAAGTYRITFTVNEFPANPPVTKAVALTSNVSGIGSQQFVACVLCFVSGLLYILLWMI